MATITKPTHRTTATLSLPRPVPALLVYATNVLKRMTANPTFPTPAPTLPVLAAAINELQAAEAAALTRVKGAAVARNEKRIALVALLQELRTYIQKVADADATNAASIIESAGVAVRKTITRHARVFSAKPGRVSGVATVVAETAARRASYEWQYSTEVAPELRFEDTGIELRAIA